MSLSLVATCVLGLEDLLAAELSALDVGDIRPQRGAVAFRGGWPDVWRANWRLRTANRVLVRLSRWAAADDRALARGAQALVASDDAWDGLTAARLFAADRSFAIRATSAHSHLSDVRWVGLRVKDGLVDGQRARYGKRASVDRESPDTALRVWLYEDRATLLLDTSGAPLDRRGYRKRGVKAPVREQLAAACVLASGWDGTGPVVDPMCGAATLLIEAGALALGWAPGRWREHWAFERLPGFDRRRFDAIRAEPLPLPEPEPSVSLHGVDSDRAAVAASHANLEAAGLADRATVSHGDGFELVPPAGPGLVLVNPAYGERLAADPESWRALGDLFKQRYAGWRAVVLAGDPGKGKHIGLRPSRRIPVKNGPLDARIVVFEIR